MSSFSLDTSEVRALVRAFEDAIPATERQVTAVVSKGALNIKREQQAAARKSKHFKGFASAISYDMRTAGAFGGGIIEAEIGPTKGKPGSLANIAYFGTSRGGGTVEDPSVALSNEEPRFISALEKLMGDLL